MKNQNGASAIEFAIVLPVLVTLIFGGIEFGLLLFNKQVITNASREGARAGIVSQSPRVTEEAIRGIVIGYCGDHLVTFGDNATALSVNATATGSTFGDDLTVLVTYKYDFLVLSNLGFGTTVLKSQTVMKME